MKFIKKYSDMNIEELINKKLKLSVNKIKYIILIVIILSIPYLLKAGATGISNFKNYLAENKEKELLMEKEEKQLKMQEMLEKSETKYRTYIDGDTTRYLSLINEYTSGNLNLKIYFNQKDNDIICHFTDKVLSEDFIVAYNPEAKISNPVTYFEEEGNLNYKFYDYSSKVFIDIEETPTGYKSYLDTMDLSSYQPNIKTEDVKIDYSNMLTAENKNISFQDDYLESVYTEGNTKYIPLLTQNKEDFTSVYQSEIEDKRTGLNIKTETFTHNSNIINYIQITLNEEVRNYIVAYNEVVSRTSILGINAISNKDNNSFELKDDVAKILIRVSYNDGSISFNYDN